jgi:hypothetical protein
MFCLFETSAVGIKLALPWSRSRSGERPREDVGPCTGVSNFVESGVWIFLYRFGNEGEIIYKILDGC